MARLPTTTEDAMVVAAVVPGTTYYLSLHTADPGTTGASEVTGGGYARQGVTFGSASSGVVSSTNTQTYTNMPGEAGGVPYLALWSAETAGNYVGGGTTSGLNVSIPAGATIVFDTGAITVTVS